MSHLWPAAWFDMDDETFKVLKDISTHWKKKGYDHLESEDYVRLEPFLEPFDAVYSDNEVVILSRVGNNGIQKQFCSMFIVKDKWILEWYLEEDDVRREHLLKISKTLFGPFYKQDEIKCMIMLTHTLSCLRQLRISYRFGQLFAEIEDDLQQDVYVQDDVCVFSSPVSEKQ